MEQVHVVGPRLVLENFLYPCRQVLFFTPIHSEGNVSGVQHFPNKPGRIEVGTTFALKSSYLSEKTGTQKGINRGLALFSTRNMNREWTIQMSSNLNSARASFLYGEYQAANRIVPCADGMGKSTP